MNYTFECTFYYHSLDKFSRALDFAKTVCLKKYGMLFQYEDKNKSITFYELSRSDVMVLLSRDTLVDSADDIMVSIVNKGEQVDGTYVKISFGDIVFLDKDFEKSIDKIIAKYELNKIFGCAGVAPAFSSGCRCNSGSAFAWPNKEYDLFTVGSEKVQVKENKSNIDPKKVDEVECFLSNDPISIHFVFDKNKKFKANQMFADARIDLYLKDFSSSCGIEYDFDLDTFVFFITTKRRYANAIWRRVFNSYFDFLEDVEYEYYTSLGERSLGDLKLPEGHIIWK